ncbi:MAG: hypothetical protein RL357_1745 [Pseudomonadota bacterium]
MSRSELPEAQTISPELPLAEPGSIQSADFIEGLAKGLRVLESFDTERQRLNATLAAQRAGITRAAARRHLLTLCHLGYLHSDGKYFWLSAKVLRFSGSYLASARLPRAVQPTLNRLAAQWPDAFSVAVLDGDSVVIVARSMSWNIGEGTGTEGHGRLLAHGLHLGARLPAHATSTGRMLLASMPEMQFEQWLAARVLPRLTLHTPTEPDALRALIAEVREHDHCIAREGHELGVHALAVPLRDLDGRVIAALNAVVPASRATPEVFRRDILPALQAAARELQALI